LQTCTIHCRNSNWLLSAAPHFELVIFAGDALDVGSLVDFAPRSSWCENI